MLCSLGALVQFYIFSRLSYKFYGLRVIEQIWWVSKSVYRFYGLPVFVQILCFFTFVWQNFMAFITVTALCLQFLFNGMSCKNVCVMGKKYSVIPILISHFVHRSQWNQKICIKKMKIEKDKQEKGLCAQRSLCDKRVCVIMGSSCLMYKSQRKKKDEKRKCLCDQTMQVYVTKGSVRPGNFVWYKSQRISIEK